MRVYDVGGATARNVPEDPTLCVVEVSDKIMWHSHQCVRKRGYGYKGQFCKQHSKKPCKHWDREEINLVADGKTSPITRCIDCGQTLPT